jgi:hypothetical protein
MSGEREPWFPALRRDWREAKKLYAVTRQSGRTHTYGVVAAIAYLLAARDPNSQSGPDA